MLVKEIQPIKPKTPDQQRVANMQATAKRATQAAQSEKARQKIAKGQQTLAKVRQQTSVIG